MAEQVKYKAMYKNELARAAGVSCSTLRRWMWRERDSLIALGCYPSTKLLPPAAVEFVCQKYGIDDLNI